MAKTESKDITLGIEAPDFTLFDVCSGNDRSLDSLKSKKATVIMFICNHCPFVKHILSKLIAIIKEYQKRGVTFIAINSNDVSKYPEDSPEHMKRLSDDLQFTFPYLFDETQEVAKKFNAACTPEFFVYNSALQLVYHGQFDDSRPGNTISITGNSLCEALDHLLIHKTIVTNQKKSIGCNIKWKE